MNILYIAFIKWPDKNKRFDWLCRYQFDRLPSPSPPRASRGFWTEMCAQPRSFCTDMCAQLRGFCIIKMPGGQANKWRGRAFVSTGFQTWKSSVQLSGPKKKIFECPIGPGKFQKIKNAISNCLFALGPQINPITNVFLTDLELSIPPKFFFESFIDKCVSTSVHSTIYWQYTFETFHLHCYLSHFHRQIQGIKRFGNVKQVACLVCGKP